MSSPNSSLKPRLPRLRASCDGCFLAKVKCSKERPICRRCLTCGTDCKYSPSSRAGKPRADGTKKARNNSFNIGSMNSSVSNGQLSSSLEQSAQSFLTSPQDQHNGSIDNLFDYGPASWMSPFGSPQEQLSRMSTSSNATSSNATSSGGDTSPDGANLSNKFMPALFDPSYVWNNNSNSSNSMTDTNFEFAFDATFNPSISHSNSDLSLASQSIAPWFKRPEDFTPTPSTPFVHKRSHSLNSIPTFSTPRTIPGNCNCFTTCLQALQALHNNAGLATPTFEMVLNVNRKAVQGCAMMMNCARCTTMSAGLGTESSTPSMLLATVIDKVMALYRSASQSHPTNQSQHQGQVRTPGEERWVELEIMWREMRKLEDLFVRFRELDEGRLVMTEGHEFGVHSALATHLGQSLQLTVGVLKMEEASLGNSMRS